MSAGDAHGGAPRARKIHEFVAHAGAEVSCAAFGRKSCSVLATGADDRRVNVWAIGNPAPLLSLTGHNSEVRCVTFDAQEEVVLAGAASGTLKLWDLHEAKCVRSLTGHRSDCEAVDFHPFGEFCASGSMDTNMKVRIPSNPPPRALTPPRAVQCAAWARPHCSNADGACAARNRALLVSRRYGTFDGAAASTRTRATRPA